MSLAESTSENVEDADFRPIAREDVSEEMLDQDLFLYDENNGTVHQLNGGAAMIWLLCDGTRTMQEIAREIARDSDVDTNEVIHEVRRTVADFQSLNLLEIQAG